MLFRCLKTACISLRCQTGHWAFIFVARSDCTLCIVKQFSVRNWVSYTCSTFWVRFDRCLHSVHSHWTRDCASMPLSNCAWDLLLCEQMLINTINYTNWTKGFTSKKYEPLQFLWDSVGYSCSLFFGVFSLFRIDRGAISLIFLRRQKAM